MTAIIIHLWRRFVVYSQSASQVPHCCSPKGSPCSLQPLTLVFRIPSHPPTTATKKKAAAFTETNSSSSVREQSRGAVGRRIWIWGTLVALSAPWLTPFGSWTTTAAPLEFTPAFASETPRNLRAVFGQLNYQFLFLLALMKSKYLCWNCNSKYYFLEHMGNSNRLQTFNK